VDIAQNRFLAALTLLTVGVLLGGGASFTYADQRIDDLEQQVQNENGQSNVVYYNPQQDSISQLLKTLINLLSRLQLLDLKILRAQVLFTVKTVI